MKRETKFPRVRFTTEVLEEAVALFGDELPEDDRPIHWQTLTVVDGPDSWTFDHPEEFFAEHRKPHTTSQLSIWGVSATRHIRVGENSGETVVAVQAPDRVAVERLAAVFDRKAKECEAPEPAPVASPPARVFIGHGRSQQWRDLKDHLHEQHGYEVEAYEVGARTGHVIRDVLDDMLNNSSFAVLVMTAEDETGDGAMRARQNVVHETGLFQGRLGFSRAIVLLEHGTEDYSNLQGIQQIRYSTGNIKETFGDVLATLRREFGRSA